MWRSSVSGSGKRSLEHDVDHLFRKLTVSEIVQLEMQKRLELDKENLELRAAVG